MDAINRLAARVLATPGDRLVVEGFRMVEDLIEFKKALPGFKVVAIEVGASRNASGTCMLVTLRYCESCAVTPSEQEPER